MTILIDDRLGSRDLIKYPPLDSLGILSRLNSADLCFCGNGPNGNLLIGIEVKTIEDLLSSIRSGRLQATQVDSMIRSEDYDVCYLLYYGEYRLGSKGELLLKRGEKWIPYEIGSKPIPWTYLESILFTLSAVGFKIKHCYSDKKRIYEDSKWRWKYDLSEVVHWIATLYKWWTREWSSHKSLRTFDSSKEISLLPGIDDATMLRAKIAAQLPGIRFERSLSVAQHFSSVREMINAGPDQWQQIDGIGPVIAKYVNKALGSGESGESVANELLEPIESTKRRGKKKSSLDIDGLNSL